MSDDLHAGEGAVRAAEALLHGTGRAVLLRIPAPAVAGDEAEQMGLATPGFEDVELAPCVFRKAGDRRELLVSGAAAAGLVGSLEFDSAQVLFATAAGVVVDGVLLQIEQMTPVEQWGSVACYRVRLKA